ncbi:FAD-binding oxidoreductase [Actinoallomurus rhizosphaericola]|uniref:FAD-binding oxidoreductase n=1 Tax=Actinoallomurus rhizosphaericola TaxID=2952536 RepID=UPI00209130AF|nr:FAD-binding oxidoreductase [Actinoallomurus rhizosphaericola]MCO5992429.1 FAD-binding oxidoreductase [Actinoallomurus rhizosphaericola]
MSALDALAKACEVRPGEDGDAVQGVTPSYVAEPGTVAEAAELMRAAAEHGLTVVPRGAGTKMHWGAPPDGCDLLVDTRRLHRIVEHAAGDLVVKTEAGLALDDLREALAGSRQQLALDPLPPGGTVGGVLATGTAGPRRLLYGSARDLLIGVTVVRADGVVAHAGGKVVKNVAGYDLGKLFTGSYGTLGLIVEAAFRLHPLPRAIAYVSATAADAGQALAMVQALLRSALVPAAIEVDGPGPITVAALFEGVPDGVPPRAEAACALIGGRAGEEPPVWWGRLPEGEVLAEVRALPTALADLFGELGGAARIRGSAGRGVWHAALPADGADDVLERLRRHGSAVVLAAPAGVRLGRWGPVPALPLMRRVKDQFDPEHRLAPGRFVGGIW